MKQPLQGDYSDNMFKSFSLKKNIYVLGAPELGNKVGWLDALWSGEFNAC